MSGQQSLLDIFEQQFASAFAAPANVSDVGATGGSPSENPFRKQYGACVIRHEGKADERVYYCHKCGKKFCWGCFQQHSD